MSTEQFNLFEPKRPAIEQAYLEGRLASADSCAAWNGKIWVSDDDLPF